MVNNLSRCTALLQQGIDRGLHMGAQVCVALKGELVADFAVGLAGKDLPLRADHRILWLSAGKPLLAVAIAQLWERGRLELGDAVSAYIPEFAEHGKSEIRISHLLTHTHAYQPPAVDWPRLSWNEVIQRICAARLPEGRRPGEYAAYDPQTTWYLLAEILQGITGEKFYDYIKSEVLVPVACKHTSIGVPAAEYTELLRQDKMALLHDTSDTARAGHLHDGLAPVWAGDNSARAAARNPGGGAVGPARDLCRFYQLLGERVLTPDSDFPLQRETAKAITARVRTGLTDHTFRQRIDWGYGFLINSSHYGGGMKPYGYGPSAGGATFGHGGVQSTSAYFDPKHQLAVAVIFNGLPGEAKHNKRSWELNSMLYQELGL